MLTTTESRRHISDHSRATVASEAVLEHLRELRSPERSVLLVLVQRPDAFLESQKALVDLGAIESRLFVLLDRVGASLAACEVDERHLAHRAISLVSDLDLEDCM